MSYDLYFFTRPSFMRGVARAIDVAGVMSREAIVYSETPEIADERARASDLAVVTRDVRVATAQLSTQLGTP